MVIFHSYVSLPEGMQAIYINLTPLCYFKSRFLAMFSGCKRRKGYSNKRFIRLIHWQTRPPNVVKPMIDQFRIQFSHLPSFTSWMYEDCTQNRISWYQWMPIPSPEGPKLLKMLSSTPLKTGHRSSLKTGNSSLFTWTNPILGYKPWLLRALPVTLP